MLSWELLNPKLWGLGSVQIVTSAPDFLGFGWGLLEAVKNLEFRRTFVTFRQTTPHTPSQRWDVGFGMWDYELAA